MNKLPIVMLGGCLAAASAAAPAQQDYATPPVAYEAPAAAAGAPALAEVISSRPDYRQVKINVPGQQVCHDEPVVGTLANDPSRKAPVDQTRCETQYAAHYEQRQVGYDVTYRYGGQVYRTHLVRDPGQQLQVEVSVVPAAAAGPSY